jgi:O-antigen/teichoic acid export membrane protein
LKHLARFRVTLHPLVRDVGLTAATEVIVLLTSLILVSLFGRLLGAVALGEYLLLRRVVAGLQSGVGLGLGVAVPRYVAHTVNGPSGKPEAYFLAGLICLTGFASCVGFLLIMGKQSFAYWLLGSAQRAHLILPLSLMLVGSAVQVPVYGYYRGMLAMGRANALEVCNLALIPIVTVTLLYRSHSVALIVSVIGCFTLFSAGLFAVPIVPIFLRGGRPPFTQQAAELLRYGIARVPGDFGGGALFAVGPMLASHYIPMGRVSHLLLGISILMAVGYSAGPLGIVLLSKVSMLLADNRIDEVRTCLGFLMDAVLELSVFGTLQLLVVADILVRLWVGSDLSQGIPIIRILLLAIPFYLFYVAFRSVIDAGSTKAYNARNIIMSLAVYPVLAVVAVKMIPMRFLLEAIAVCMLATLVVLAWLTASTTRRLYRLKVAWGHYRRSMLVALVLGGVSVMLHWSQHFPRTAVQLATLEVAMAGLFLLAILKLGSPWLEYLWSAAFEARRQAKIGMAS